MPWPRRAPGGAGLRLSRPSAGSRARELAPPRVDSIEPVLNDEARQVVAEWQRDGGYDRALAAISETDPELAVQ